MHHVTTIEQEAECVVLYAKRRVMRRVYTRFIARKLVWFAAAGVGLLTLFLVSVAYLVSMEEVFVNISLTWASGTLMQFLYSAVANTESTLQILLAVGLGYGVALVLRTLQTVKRVRRSPAAVLAH